MNLKKVSNSFWWVWAFIPFLNWVSWLHLSLVCSVRKYYLHCIAFLIPNVIVIIASNTDQSEQTTPIEGIIAVVWLAAWIYGIVSTLKEKKKLISVLPSGAQKEEESHSTQKQESLSDYKIQETSSCINSKDSRSIQVEVSKEHLITSTNKSKHGLFTTRNLSGRSIFLIVCACLAIIVIGGLLGFWDDETQSSHNETSITLQNTQSPSTQNTTPSSQVSSTQSVEQDSYRDELIEDTSEQYWINGSARSIGYRKFEVDIETNIPGSFQLGASFQLQGQDPEDLFIGTQFIRVPISNGAATFIIDGTYITFPEDGLPPGDYWIRVIFSHYWSDNSNVVRATKIDSIIEYLIPVRID